MDPFPGYSYSSDAQPEVMRHRKRALATGQFCFKYRDDEDNILEDSKEFQEAVDRWGKEGAIKFGPRPLQEEMIRRKPYRTRFAASWVEFPGVGDRFNVAWFTPSGDVRVDPSVKLYDHCSIQNHYEILFADQEPGVSPGSPEFGLVEPTLTYNKKVGFDANMFWSVGLLFKHFSTCGMDAWDMELSQLKRAFLGQDDSMMANNSNNNVVKMEAGGQLMRDLHGKRYTGCVMEWRGTYGFLSCNHIPSKVFLHGSQVSWCGPGQGTLPCGTSVNFTLMVDPVKGCRAVEATLFT